MVCRQRVLMAAGAYPVGYPGHTSLLYMYHFFGEAKTSNQEAQPSQRLATLRVIEYFAKSLKITQGHWKWHSSKDWVRFHICLP